MAGYNPVSGGLLNKATFGKFGDPTNYGLQRAYDKRIGNQGTGSTRSSVYKL